MDSIDSLWQAALPLIVFASLALNIRQSRRSRHAAKYLLEAKREVSEIAQLPLNNPHPLVQVSQEAGILFVNDAAKRCFPNLIEQGQHHPMLKGLDQVFQKNAEACREICVDGIHYEQTVLPTLSADAKTFVLYCFDITERKRQEGRLSEARQAADAANQARGDFLANMSHEIRTPMNGIIGLSDVLLKSQLPQQQRDLVSAVNNASRTLLILLNDILDFSKIEAGELSIDAAPIDMRAALKQVALLQKPLATRKGLSLTCSVETDFPPSLLGDVARYQQIFSNLIGNAVKFTQRGTVAVNLGGSLDEDGRFNVQFRVKDTGIGIPPDRQTAIFAKFQQATHATARDYGGTGLGLTITKDLVEMMDGAIRLESTPGKGTMFTVTLPAAIAQAPMAEQSCRAPDASINTALKILIVDDHPINLLYLRQILTTLQIQMFHEAGNGRDAAALFERYQHDLVFMDCQMPGMDGFETAKAIRAVSNHKNGPVIVAVTANAMKGAASKCMDQGMDGYICKPFDQAQIEAVLVGYSDRGAAQLPVPSDDAPPGEFDWRRFDDVTKGDGHTQTKLIDLFVESVGADFAALKNHLRAKDCPRWLATAHRMYGACGSIGATHLAAVCDQAQTLAEADFGRAASLTAQIGKAYDGTAALLQTRSKFVLPE